MAPVMVREGRLKASPQMQEHLEQVCMLAGLHCHWIKYFYLHVNTCHTFKILQETDNSIYAKSLHLAQIDSHESGPAGSTIANIS